MPVFFLALLSLLLGCGDALPLISRQSLQDKYDSKLAELREKTKDHIGGWPSDIDCDAALAPDGRPTRRPSIKQYGS